MTNSVRPKIAEQMNDIAGVITDELPKTHGFCLLVMYFPDNGQISYISNVERRQMLGAMKVFLDHWESQK